jgi:hypothetical protein
MHHNKVLELLVLVFIGAGLVPLHHRLEHIVLKKITKGKKPVANNVEKSEENLSMAAEEINSNTENPQETNPAPIFEVEADINKNSSPVNDDTGDEQKES